MVDVLRDDSILQQLGDKNIAAELIGQDEEIRKTFLSLTDLDDKQEANDFAWCFHKCERHNLASKLKLFEYMIYARVSVKAKRAGQVVDMVTGIQVAAAELAKKNNGKDGANK